MNVSLFPCGLAQPTPHIPLTRATLCRPDTTRSASCSGFLSALHLRTAPAQSTHQWAQSWGVRGTISPTSNRVTDCCAGQLCWLLGGDNITAAWTTQLRQVASGLMQPFPAGHFPWVPPGCSPSGSFSRLPSVSRPSPPVTDISDSTRQEARPFHPLLKTQIDGRLCKPIVKPFKSSGFCAHHFLNMIHLFG